MSRTPELSSMHPTLIGPSAAWACRSGKPAVKAVAPAVFSNVLRDMAIDVLLGLRGRPLQKVTSLLLAAIGIVAGLALRDRGRRRVDRGRKVEADRIADASERGKLQRHAENAVHHLI